MKQAPAAVLCDARPIEIHIANLNRHHRRPHRPGRDVRATVPDLLGRDSPRTVGVGFGLGAEGAGGQGFSFREEQCQHARQLLFWRCQGGARRWRWSNRPPPPRGGERSGAQSFFTPPRDHPSRTAAPITTGRTMAGALERSSRRRSPTEKPALRRFWMVARLH